MDAQLAHKRIGKSDLASETPVLLVVFNRPEKTERVIAALRAAAPRLLYVAADGPRPEAVDDRRRCARARQLVEGIDWPCELHTLFQDRNLGCKRGVETAIDWFFANANAGIIVEDDCVPAPAFFPFCAELLERYHDADEVMMIAGHNQLGEWRATGDYDYVFSRTPPIWGWATWRRAWARYEPALTRWEEPHVCDSVRRRMFRAEFRIMKRRFDRVYEHRYDTWDFGWAFAMASAGGVAAVTAKNLVENIGFDADASHTRAPWPHEVGLSTYDVTLPLVGPPSTAPDDAFDLALFRRRFPLRRRITSALPRPLRTPLRHGGALRARL